MKPDEQELHRFTERLMQKAGTVPEPSGFTERVMDSVLQAAPSPSRGRIGWPWLPVIILMVLLAAGWYFFMPAAVNTQVGWYLAAALAALQPLLSSLLVFFRKFSEFSSLLWMGAAAVFCLLLLEGLLNRRKIQI